MRHPDGVYLDVPMTEYLADDAIGGHGAALLARSPTDWRFERPDNPLFRPRQSPDALLGNLLHAYVLEGEAVFSSRYCREPERADFPDALDTMSDIRRWIEARNRDLADEHDGTGKPRAIAKSGTKDEALARIRDECAEFGLPEPVSWEQQRSLIVGERAVISPHDFDAAVAAANFALAHYGTLLAPGAGLSEVSIFWTDDDARFKARLDRATPQRIVDLKKFGRPPRQQHNLRRHLVYEATDYGYPVQAVMHSYAAQAAVRIVRDLSGDVVATGPRASERIDRLIAIVDAWAARPPLFTWLFVRLPGPLCAKPLPFRPSDPMWSQAAGTIETAVDNYRRYREMFAEDELWAAPETEEEISAFDWPPWAMAAEREFE